MAEAIIEGLIRESVIPAGKIIAAGPRQERLDELMQRYGIQTDLDNAQAVKDADVVVICVKPQKLTEVLNDLKGQIPPKTLVISIVAGATCQQLKAGLDHDCVVRSMPNTPAQVGEGMTVWTQTEATSESQHGLAQQILAALGP